MKKILYIILALLLSFTCMGCSDKEKKDNEINVNQEKNANNPEGADETLLGASEIYPTVMVDGHLYEWRRGKALHYLPSDSIYYGEINHIDGKKPTKNCEFVSVFSVSGKIYTVSDNIDYVYLQLTTDWMEETTVIFDLISE